MGGKMSPKFLFFILILSFSAVISGLQSPEEFFKQSVGDNRVLINYPEICRYFKYLAENSPRVRYSEEGRSTLGNPLMLAVISSEENIRNLERLIAINRQLQNPDQQSEEQNRKLLEESKLFVLITGTIHSTEIGASQAMTIWAHKLASSRDPEVEKMLAQVVLLLMPSINPDGHIMVVDWYRKYLGTKYEGAPLPFLYHHYAGHDNNRDYCFLNLSESRVVNRIVVESYIPAIYLDMHQMGSTGPRIFVPPFANPLNPNLSPLMIRQSDLIGSYIAFYLQQKGLKGVATNYGFDAYWPGGTKNTAWYKNVIGLLSEVASCRIASPIYIEANELRGGGKGLPVYQQMVNFPDPWPGGWWGLKEIINYELFVLDALLEVCSRNSDHFRHNFYQMGKENIACGHNEKPAGYLIPAEQGYPAYLLLSKLQENGVRIFRLRSDIEQEGMNLRKGCYLVPLAQPFRPFVKAMFEKQRYPEIPYLSGGPIIEPYDNSGWTMPLLIGTKFYPYNQPIAAELIEPVKISPPAATITGNGEYYRFASSEVCAFQLVNQLLKKGITVWRIKTGKEQGDFLVATRSINEKELPTLAAGTGLRIVCGNFSTSSAVKLKLPRIAIYQPYLASMDEGWTRWVLDQFQFPYRVVRNPDFKDKSLLKNFDLLLIASIDRELIVEGKYPQSEYFNPEGLPPEYRGGIGQEGIKQIKEFVREGGRLVLLDASWEIARKDFEININNLLSREKSEEFSCPGSILRIQINNQDPLGWGMPEEGIIYFASSVALRTAIPASFSFDRRVVAKFSPQGEHLLSGYLKGGKLLDNAVVAVRYNFDKGMLFVFAGRIQYRGQTFASFPLLFNALLFPTEL